MTALPKRIVKETERLIQIGLIAASSILAAQVNATPKKIADQASGSCDAHVLSSNIIFQTLNISISEEV